MTAIAEQKIPGITLLCLNGRGEKQNDFGIVLRIYRQEKGLTQEQLGERVDVVRSFICSLENGNRQPSLQMVLKLAAALGIRAGELMNAMEDRIANR